MSDVGEALRRKLNPEYDEMCSLRERLAAAQAQLDAERAAREKAEARAAAETERAQGHFHDFCRAQFERDAARDERDAAHARSEKVVDYVLNFLGSTLCEPHRQAVLRMSPSEFVEAARARGCEWCSAEERDAVLARVEKTEKRQTGQTAMRDAVLQWFRSGVSRSVVPDSAQAEQIAIALELVLTPTDAP